MKYASIESLAGGGNFGQVSNQAMLRKHLSQITRISENALFQIEDISKTPNKYSPFVNDIIILHFLKIINNSG